MSIFEPESLAIFAGNTQKYSQINYSKTAQKVLDSLRSYSFESISDAIGLEVILYTVRMLLRFL